ncbi:hypothetical protein KP014_23260 [Paenibacillus sophorae]|uniref:Uncharacterized protein n=1 Tax=Paenibacillus sophorae TaxID=1333845 RepID=A0ABX8HCS1_9BACL|nr:hypothetical protein [Paenibacillus sophorae]QWU14812.1 hypothetical protein KP014_23260 [Paenibacillus sophorae]
MIIVQVFSQGRSANNKIPVIPWNGGRFAPTEAGISLGDAESLFERFGE